MTLTKDRPAEWAAPGMRRMKVLAVGSQKGGAAKSTTSLYLATRFAEYMGGTQECPIVGLLDRDGTSKNLSEMLRLHPEMVRPGVTILDGEDLPEQSSGLRLVVIDTPPGLAAIDSLRSADLLVVPVIPSEQGVVNLVQYLRNIKGQRVSVSPHMRLLALLPSAVRNTRLHREVLDAIKDIAGSYDPPLPVLPPIPQRTAIEEWNLDAREYDAAAKELFEYARI
ncbi:MAG: ParA family protein [Chloroflexota bacterium]|nr:ParA family protein [Chloroflexota bacterium]